MLLLTMSSPPLPLPLPLSFPATEANSHQHRPCAYLSSVQNSIPYTHAELQLNSEDPGLCHFQPNSAQKPKTIRYRLSQLCREGQLELARQLFDDIPQPTTVVWNTMMIGCICNNLHHEAIALYSQMKWGSGSHKFEPDPYTFSSVLKACAEMMELRIGKAVHCHILRSEANPGRIVYNSLLNMYASCLNSYTLSSCRRMKMVFEMMPKRNVVAWNTIISWYSKVRRPIEALLHFSMMMKTGLKPTVVSFINVFRAASLMDVHAANVLFGLVMKLGKGYADDLFVVSSAIYMYSELSCLSNARRIFDNCLERNTEIWNSMISGYVQNSCPAEALDLFLRALQSPDAVSIDEVTLLSTMTATSQLQNLKIAQQLHAYVVKCSFISHSMILNSIISMYSKCNNIKESFHCFTAMKDRDIVSWNTIVSALVQNESDDEALMLVKEMQNQGFVIDAVTITAVLSAASNLRDGKLGTQTHAYIVRHGIQFEGMNTYLIDMYAKSGMVQAAERIFYMNCLNSGDQATWNSMISSYTHNGLIEQSLAIFRQMLENNVTPTAVTFSSILPACSQSGNLTLGKLLHGFVIRNFLDDNVFVTTALVDMYSKTGAIHYAERLFKRSPQKNSVTCTNMIMGYGQHGMGLKAVTLFDSLKEFGVEPDRVTFSAVLSACSYCGLVTEGLQVFESMARDYGLQPEFEHYSCLIDMLGRVGRLIEAYEYVKELSLEYNVHAIWGLLLSACIIHGHFELGKIVADKLLRIDGGNKKTGYHVLLSNIYASEGNWKFANKVRREMREEGLTKEVGCSWIDISGYAHCFVSRDENRPNCSEVYQILGQLTANMKDAGYRPSLKLQELWLSKFME